MTPPRAIALATGTLLLLVVALAFRSTRADYSDGEAAVANVARLRKGQGLGEALRTLHPGRTDPGVSISYTMRPVSGEETSMIHGLSLERHLAMRCDGPRPGSATGEPELRSWELREGPAPREDVAIGRNVEVGPVRFFY